MACSAIRADSAFYPALPVTQSNLVDNSDIPTMVGFCHGGNVLEGHDGDDDYDEENTDAIF